MGRERAAEPSVHEGLDGWLFLVGGSNRPLDAYRPSLARAWRLRRWARLVRARERRAAALGARFLQLVVPEKPTIYADLAPGLAIDPELSAAAALRRLLRGSPAFVDAIGPLRAARAVGPAFLRTDTHWTLEGCHAVYRALCAAAGAAPRLDLADRPTYDHPLVGDLGAKLDPPRGEPSRRYVIPRDARRVWANEPVLAAEAAGSAFALHRGAAVAFRNDAPDADPRRVVLFGDSCAHFDPFMLTGMLAETFRELHFVWSASLDWPLVERLRPDLLVAEIAERFLRKVPRDDFDAAAFAAERAARISGEQVA